MHQPKERGGRELPAKVVQQLLGHSSIVMTLDRYGHLFPRGDDRAELAGGARAAGVSATQTRHSGNFFNENNDRRGL